MIPASQVCALTYPLIPSFQGSRARQREGTLLLVQFCLVQSGAAQLVLRLCTMSTSAGASVLVLQPLFQTFLYTARCVKPPEVLNFHSHFHFHFRFRARDIRRRNAEVNDPRGLAGQTEVQEHLETAEALFF